MSRGPRLILVAGAVAVAAVAFVIARPGDSGDGGSKSSSTTTTAQKRPEPRYERVQVRGGQPAGGVKDVTVRKGDTVRIAVTSDTADEVHVHGYDIKKDVKAGGTVRFRFAADIEGVFEMELEGAHVQIAKLTVEP